MVLMCSERSPSTCTVTQCFAINNQEAEDGTTHLPPSGYLLTDTVHAEHLRAGDRS